MQDSQQWPISKVKQRSSGHLPTTQDARARRKTSKAFQILFLFKTFYLCYSYKEKTMLWSPRLSLSNFHVKLTAKGLFRNLQLLPGCRKNTMVFHAGLKLPPQSSASICRPFIHPFIASSPIVSNTHVRRLTGLSQNTTLNPFSCICTYPKVWLSTLPQALSVFGVKTTL